MDSLAQRALDGATAALGAAAWLTGALIALAVIAAVAYGPMLAVRAARYRLHVHRVTARLRSEV